MEGYTNVSSNLEDFDDLNIEGRKTMEEWKGDEESVESKKEPEKVLQQRLLSLKVRLYDGSYGYVFSSKPGHNDVIRWRCHLCDVYVMGHEHVDTHIQSKKHQVKLALPSHSRNLFTRVETKPQVELPTLAPGEPVPPGFEEEVRSITQIQATLDSHKSSPLIGLEYLVELTPEERGKEPMYVCMLCDKKGDPRVAMAHLTSFNHRSKYIGIHFPSANKAMMNVIPRNKDGKKVLHLALTNLCTKIEERYGRLQPVIVERDLFQKKKNFYKKQIDNDKHFRETPSETFVEQLDKSVIDKLAAFEDVPLPTADSTKEDVKSGFNKGKITCDRSRLRHRENEDENEEEENVYKKLQEMDRMAERVLKADRKTSVESDIKKRKMGSDRKSLSSVSSISSSSLSPSHSTSRSKSRSRSRSNSQHRSRYGRRNYLDSRYRRNWGRGRRSNSRSRSRRSRSRSRTPPYRSRHWRDRSRSPQYGRRKSPRHDDKIKKGKDQSGHTERSKWAKFREEADKVEVEATKLLKFHEKNPEKHPMYPEEWKIFWNRRYKELQAEGKDPSKHDFKPEWIKFWNCRMRELYEEELKTKKEEWKLKLGLPKEEEEVRMGSRKRKVIDEDVICLSPSPSRGREEKVKKDVTVTDIKNTWKALTGSDIKDTTKRSPSPWEEMESAGLGSSSPPSGKWDRFSKGASCRGSFNRGRGRGIRFRSMYDSAVEESANVVTVLRLLTAMENQLGSLGPRVNTLLAKALALEKMAPDSSYSMLTDQDNLVLFETVKEKLKGQLFAGIVERNMVMATRSAIQNLCLLLNKAEKMVQDVKVEAFRSKLDPVESPLTITPTPVLKSAPIEEPVIVPGVGTMDKLAIAQQIASALVAQGKTNVTQEELEQLINAVVGMAQSSSGSEEQSMSTADFVSHIQQQKQHLDRNQLHTTGPGTQSILIKPDDLEITPLQKLLSTVGSNRTSMMGTGPRPSSVTALQMLQSAYDEPRISPGSRNLNKLPVSSPRLRTLSYSPPSKISDRPPLTLNPLFSMNRSEKMDELTDEEMKSLLQNFNDLSSKEQNDLIMYLKKLEAKDPERVERLRKFVNMESATLPVSVEPVNRVRGWYQSHLDSPLKRDQTRCGRLSPFSMRQGGANPMDSYEKRQRDEEDKRVEAESKDKQLVDSEEEDYSFEDIYAAASKKVKEREAKAEEAAKQQKAAVAFDKIDKSDKNDDPKSVLRETKALIANLMGQLPGKFIQKQTDSPIRDSPAVQQNESSTKESSKDLISGQKISTVHYAAARPVPTLDPTERLNKRQQLTQLPPPQQQQLTQLPPPQQQQPMQLQQQQQQQQQYAGYQNPNPEYGIQFGNQGSFPNGAQSYTDGPQGYNAPGDYGGYYSGGQQEPASQQNYPVSGGYPAPSSFPEPSYGMPTDPGMGHSQNYPDQPYPDQFEQQSFRQPAPYNQYPSYY